MRGSGTRPDNCKAAEGRCSEEKVNPYHRGPYHWFLPYFYALKHERPLQMLGNRWKPSDTVLDLGCGDGRHSALIAEHVQAVVGLDHQMLPLQFARLLVHHENVTLCRGDGARLPFRSEVFNLVTCFDVIEHLPQARVPQLVNEVGRVLQPDGLFVVTTPNRGSLRNRLWGHQMSKKHYYEYTLNELSEIVNGHGFSIEQVSGIYLPPPILQPYLEHYANVFPVKHGFRLLINAGAQMPGWSETLFLAARPKKANYHAS